MDINLIVWTLLAGRMVSLGLILAVISMQVPFIRANVDSRLQPMRKVLLILMLAFLFGNLVSIAIDVGTLLGFRAGWTVVVYAYTNDLTVITASGAIYALYRIAAKL